MDCKLLSKEIEELKPTSVLQQTSYWAKLKYRQGLEPYAFKIVISKDLINPAYSEMKQVSDDILILIKHLDSNLSYAYIPYGPKLKPAFENYGLLLEELSEVVRPYLPKDCIFIRYDLPWENQWSAEEDFFDNDGNWTGPPPAYNQEFRINFNTHYWNLMKSPSDNLPTSTYFLKLDKSEDQILAGMKSKTRYNIRLSKRKGVEVNEYGIEKLDQWYDLYKETSRRNGINLHRKEFFEQILTCKSNKDRNIRSSLLLASHGGDYLSAMFLILSAKRATYLYGASSSEKRNLMSTYAIQWEAIRKAKDFGCIDYDMFGCAPNSNHSHPLHGLYRFKRGFGGKMYHRMGCWDYPLDKSEYRVFRAKEIKAQKYHVN